MKATLEFDLSKERKEYDCAMHGYNYHEVIANYIVWLRSVSSRSETVNIEASINTLQINLKARGIDTKKLGL